MSDCCIKMTFSWLIKVTVIVRKNISFENDYWNERVVPIGLVVVGVDCDNGFIAEVMHRYVV